MTKNKRSSLFLGKIGLHHQLPHRVTPAIQWRRWLLHNLYFRAKKHHFFSPKYFWQVKAILHTAISNCFYVIRFKQFHKEAFMSVLSDKYLSYCRILSHASEVEWHLCGRYDNCLQRQIC